MAGHDGPWQAAFLPCKPIACSIAKKDPKTVFFICNPHIRKTAIESITCSHWIDRSGALYLLCSAAASLETLHLGLQLRHCRRILPTLRIRLPHARAQLVDRLLLQTEAESNWPTEN
jgi:hypothetical protein